MKTTLSTSLGPNAARLLALGLTLLWPLAAAPAAPEVPAAQRALYDHLDRQLTAVEDYLARTPTPKLPSKPPTIFTGELLAASSNLGERLLEPQRMRSVEFNLDRMQAIGFGGVGLCLQYPMLLPEFPRSDEYRTFYRKVAEAVRARGLLLSIEVNVFFGDPAFSPVRWSYRGLTLEKFADGLHEMNAWVVRELKPDYLFCIDEPDTILQNIGLKASEEALLSVVARALGGFEKGATRLGSGAGTWTKPAYFEKLLALPEVEVLNLHIYPISDDLLTQRFDAICALAREKGRPLVSGESWLYKAGRGELGGGVANAAVLFARDAYSFWEPLDTRFFNALATQAERHGFLFCNFFWVRYFFGMIDHTPETAALAPAAVFQKANQRAAQTMLRGEFSPLGEKMRALLAEKASAPRGR